MRPRWRFARPDQAGAACHARRNNLTRGGAARAGWPTLEEITSIVDLLLADLNKRLADRRVTVLLDAKAKEWAAEKGYDPVFGARPLKRFLQRQIETKLARALIAGEVAEGSEVKFRVAKDELVREDAGLHV